MNLIVFLFIVLALILIGISALIFRHTIKFKHLSPRFKYIVALFAIISMTTIIFGIYLIFTLDSNSTSNLNNSGSSNNSGELNF